MMNEIFLKKYGDPENCPVRNVIDRIGGKWAVLVLMILEDGDVLRFNEICTCIKTISQKMLAVTLKSLEADGLVERKVYPQIPPRVEYRLTPRGKSLIPHLLALINWANDNMADIRDSRGAFRKVAY